MINCFHLWSIVTNDYCLIVCGVKMGICQNKNRMEDSFLEAFEEMFLKKALEK